MRTTPRLSKRSLVTGTGRRRDGRGEHRRRRRHATPSHAATCNGYVGLTFDDGPSNDHTPSLLNALRQNGLRATMFNEGQYAAAVPVPGPGRGQRRHVGRQPQLHPPAPDPAEPVADGSKT